MDRFDRGIPHPQTQCPQGLFRRWVRAAPGLWHQHPTGDLVPGIRGKSTAEAAAIDNFLRSRGAVQSFDWTTPSGIAGKFLCEEWSRTVEEPNLENIRVTFRQVFDLS